VLALVTASAYADRLIGLADVTVVGDAIVSLRYEGVEYVVANGDLVLGTTTRWYIPAGGVATLWVEGDPAPAATVAGTSDPKVGDVGSKADNFLFRLGGSNNISSVDGIDFQETIFAFLADTFFLFERGGNDTGTWQAILADGSLGQPVAFSAASVYANTGVDVGGQNAFGVVFKTDVPVQGVRITASGHDTLSISTPIVRKSAYNPSPQDLATDVPIPVILTWTASKTAVFHNVYLGTNPTLGPDELVSPPNSTQTMYWHIPGYNPGTTYYWRIDEVEIDGVTVHTGNVWSFTTASVNAHNPDPPDGATFVSTEADLSWQAGIAAITHDVYFGTNEAAVAAGTGGTSKGNQQPKTFDPGALAKGTTYYWRIDEVEADKTTKHTGDLWSFSTMPEIIVTDPDLIGWWKLDEGSGTTAVDWSGHDLHGTLTNGPQWVDGYHGGALEFDGIDDGVEFANFVPPLQGTITFWINPASVGPRGRIFGGADEFEAYVQNGLFHNQLFAAGDAPNYLISNATIQTDTWTHVALTYDGTSHRLQTYLNGTLDGENSTADDVWNGGAFAFAHRAGGNQEYYYGLLDDFRIYKKVLTQEQIKETMRGDLKLAWNPKPTDKSTTDVEKAVPVTWSPGDMAAQHDVYFGTDRLAVAGADTTTANIYRLRQNVTSYTPPEGLQWGQTYYWRIDEYNTDGTLSAGGVWSFTVANYLIVDDFEDYTDDVGSRIFQTWKDGLGFTEPPPGYLGNGTGSTVGNAQPPYAEQTIFHTGSQSMPLNYDNTGPGTKKPYSETQREWTSPQDWTRYNVKALTLYFYGAAANAAEQLYVAVEDSAGRIKVVSHDNPDAALLSSWQEWPIELTQFSADPVGVNLKAIKRMYIGLGNRTSPKLGGTGTIYIDDIRLYRSRCVPSKAKPAASFNDDCIVDNLDLQMMAEDWLVRDVPEAAWNGAFSSQDIGAGTAAGSFSFDGNVYTITADGNDIWGTADAFRYAYKQVSGDFQMTVRVTGLDPVDVWSKAGVMVRQSLDPGSANAMIATSGTSGGGATFQWRPTQGASSSSQRLLESAYAVTEPACIRLVRQGSTISGYVFVDSRWQLEGQTTAVVLTGPVYIGLAVTSHVDGTLTTATFDRACVFSVADLRVDGIVDFKDYAVLVDAWLDELLWP